MDNLEDLTDRQLLIEQTRMMQQMVTELAAICRGVRGVHEEEGATASPNGQVG